MAFSHPAIRVAFRVLIAVAALGAVFFLLRWGWRSWRAFGDFLIPWWRDNLADPILRLLLRALDAADGDLLWVLLMIALATWLMSKIIVGTVMAWGATQASRQAMTNVETAVASVEDVHSRLRSLFADDVEKIAFYESRLGTRRRRRSAARSQLLGCGGCLFSLVWWLVSTPFSMMVGVAVFDGVQRLFGGYGERQVVESAAGPLADVLHAHPPPTHCLGFALQERSLTLTLLCLLIGVTWSLLSNVSVSGWTLPSVKPPSLWLSLIPTSVLLYIFLDGLLLIWTFLTGMIWVLDAVLKIVWRSVYLRLRRIAHRLRQRPPSPA